MKQQPDQAGLRLWEDFRSWMKDHCFAANLTVLEISASEFQVKTNRGRKLHIEFNADRAGSVTYKFEDGAEHQLQLLVTIRAQAYFATDGKRYSARELGQKILNDLVPNR